ncbi:unnamed protein product [Rhizophagus irregularis]|nr:unnamed protein product [Rhizophagus irregularis]
MNYDHKRAPENDGSDYLYSRKIRFLKLFGVNHSVLCWRQSVRQSCSRIDSRFFINIFEAKTDWPKLRMNG